MQLTVSEIEQGNYAASLELQTTTCPRCHITHAAPKQMIEDARNDANITIYCPAGHKAHWPGETREDKLERQLKGARDDAARARAREDQARASKRAHKAAATRARNERDRVTKRAKAGVCPCCNRTVKQLAQHMESKHPDYEPGESHSS